MNTAIEVVPILEISHSNWVRTCHQYWDGFIKNGPHESLISESMLNGTATIRLVKGTGDVIGIDCGNKFKGRNVSGQYQRVKDREYPR